MKRENIKFNKSKIVATVGPASNTKEMLQKLVKAGADVFRLNFSHGDHETHQQTLGYIEEINKEWGTNISILQDLQGPKIRLGDIVNGKTVIKEGDEFIITINEIEGDSKKASTTYQGLPSDVKKGDTILIDDGNIQLEVISSDKTDVKTKVIYGGDLKSKKGINLPFTKVSAPSLTEKDLEDLKFGLKNEVDWIALSFVRSAADVLDLKNRIRYNGKDCKVVAKIEKPEALKDIDNIIAATDAVMVARGDLGVEIPMEDVPLAQKMIIKKCNDACKPVIVATQMMESMIENPRPTRAETNDVANAILDGGDAVMLSAESAAGQYPVEAVLSMSNTIASIEKHTSIYHKYGHVHRDSETFFSDNLVQTACKLAEETGAKAIVGMTKSGYTAYRLASHRPKAGIFIFTGNNDLLETINLVWGVRGYIYNNYESTDKTFADIEKILKKDKHVETGDIIILMASMPIKEKNRTNMLKVTEVK
ncbi:pyruvate kinase [Marivirga arenosa]|uniref:Pyruvate kinase n=1 Tax=Marivirga arenosa TaxID=3059076 RepID=A0AA49GG28_9BACT|nr:MULTISPECIES: pyruvate kinase [unclassified Marivirga]WKK79697.2 pyruvate kinase [Marivirga sp. BKB1-2]WKK85215.2 pyruvate kinase [Marivirga sp. ABR2-2]